VPGLEEFRAGDVVVQEGELDDSFFVIVSEMPPFTRARRSWAPQGRDCFGEMGYLNKTKRTATVRAKTD